VSYRIYYADGSTYDGDPWQAPFYRALLILERDPDHGRRIVSGADYYCWMPEENRWRGYDLPGMMQYMYIPGPKRYLVGEMVNNDLWNATYRRAENDPDFPSRTAYGVYEEKGAR